MKRSLLKLALAAAALMAPFASPLSECFAQGSLTPPGPPAPTMKSLDQIEPRTIVNAANTPGDSSDMFIISKPGSYYLTTNIVATSGMNGITIEANNVTLDLGGFFIQGTGAGLYAGVLLPGNQTNITVRNGNLSGWGFSGVLSYSVNNVNLLFEHLNSFSSVNGIAAIGPATIRDCTATGGGPAGYGIVCDGFDAPGGGVVSHCTANNNSGGGIFLGNGRISECTANTNDAEGFTIVTGTASGCSASYNTGDGIDIAGIVLGCVASYNGGYGINADAVAISGNQISDCVADYNTNSGIYATGSVVSRCTTIGNHNNGVETDPPSSTASASIVTGCMVQNNYQNGIFVNGSGGLIADNNCSFNNTSDNPGCAGICVYGSSANNRIENNHITGTGYAGINVSGANNIIIKNSVSGNGANNYILSGNQVIGPMINGTGTITSSSPWANFSY